MKKQRRGLDRYKTLSKIHLPYKLVKKCRLCFRVQLLSENSDLFALIEDTVIALKKKNKQENNGKPSP